jgi:hypothetical protein
MSDEDEVFDQDEQDDEADELEADADEDSGDAVEAIEAADEDEDAVVATPVGRAARGEIPEAHSVAARAALRNTLAADVEAFLARGGSIQEVADDQRAEPAKKSDTSYGRGTA